MLLFENKKELKVRFQSKSFVSAKNNVSLTKTQCMVAKWNYFLAIRRISKGGVVEQV